MNKKAIYLFTHSFPEIGGEPYLQNEIEAIARDAYKLTFCPYGVKSNANNVLNKNFIFKKTDIFLAIIFVISGSFKAPIKLTFLKFRYLVALVKERIAAARFYAKNIDQNAIIYAYWFDELSILTHLIKKIRPDLTCISRAHGFDVYEDQSDINYLFFKQKKLAAIQNLYVVSKHGANYLKKQFPQYAHKITNSYLGCTGLEFSKTTNNDILNIATCAYIRSIKRINLIFDALKLCNKNVIFHVIGDGPDLQLLQKKQQELPNNVTCIFYGNCTKKEIENIYKNGIDCFVNVSSSEGLPVSIMEAISAGIPVVATAVGGTPEIVNEQTGKLIEPNFTNIALLNAITEIAIKGKNLDYKIAVFTFWNLNFNALKNYKTFYKEINA